jgi:hypothetical protein
MTPEQARQFNLISDLLGGGGQAFTPEAMGDPTSFDAAGYEQALQDAARAIPQPVPEVVEEPTPPDTSPVNVQNVIDNTNVPLPPPDPMFTPGTQGVVDLPFGDRELPKEFQGIPAPTTISAEDLSSPDFVPDETEASKTINDLSSLGMTPEEIGAVFSNMDFRRYSTDPVPQLSPSTSDVGQFPTTISQAMDTFNPEPDPAPWVPPDPSYSLGEAVDPYEDYYGMTEEEAMFGGLI